MLKISQLYLNKGRPILNGISLLIPRGRTTLLLGKSGSGKTSLLRCIAQIEHTYQGEVSYQNQNLHLLSSKKRCRLIGFVSQNPSLFPHMTVIENCRLPLKVVLKEEKKVEETLRLLDMGKYGSSYPHQLSGGQQQRVAIARALLLDPDFLLFDEPTSALDPENTELLYAIIQTLQKKGTGIAITSQDMAFAARVIDRAYFLEEGSIIETHDSAVLPNLPSDSKMAQFLFGLRQHTQTT